MGVGGVGMGHMHHAGDAFPSPQHRATAHVSWCVQEAVNPGKILCFGKESLSLKQEQGLIQVLLTLGLCHHACMKSSRNEFEAFRGIR